jgi:hypothetical protein
MEIGKVAFVLLLLCLLAMCPVGVQADTKSDLSFIKDVIGIDVEKYDVTLVSSIVQDYTNANNPIGNLGYIDTSKKYTLANWDTATNSYSELDVRESLANSTLRLCSLAVDSGQPYYSNPLPTNTRDAAKTILQRYAMLSKDTELTTMSNLLSNVDLTKDSVKTQDGIKLEVSIHSDIVSIAFIESQNGVDFGRVTLEFQGGKFLTFFDSRSYTRIGSAEVNVSKEQAISMALNTAKDFSYKYNGQLIDNLTYVESAIRTELRSNVRDTPTLFYPCWLVDLPLNSIYPGAIYYVEVKIWADTGQILKINEMGYGGVIGNSQDTTPTNSPISTPTFAPSITVPETQTATTNTTLFEVPINPTLAVLIVSGVIAIVAAFSLIFYKSHRKAL